MEFSTCSNIFSVGDIFELNVKNGVIYTRVVKIINNFYICFEKVFLRSKILIDFHTFSIKSSDFYSLEHRDELFGCKVYQVPDQIENFRTINRKVIYQFDWEILRYKNYRGN